MARSNAAQSRPPVKELPSAPAGAYDGVSELLGVVVEHERRRGRGAQINVSGRYEPLARVAFDDGWRTLVDRLGQRRRSRPSPSTWAFRPELSADGRKCPPRGLVRPLI